MKVHKEALIRLDDDLSAFWQAEAEFKAEVHSLLDQGWALLPPGIFVEINTANVPAAHALIHCDLLTPSSNRLPCTATKTARIP